MQKAIQSHSRARRKKSRGCFTETLAILVSRSIIRLSWMTSNLGPLGVFGHLAVAWNKQAELAGPKKVYMFFGEGLAQKGIQEGARKEPRCCPGLVIIRLGLCLWLLISSKTHTRPAAA